MFLFFAFFVGSACSSIQGKTLRFLPALWATLTETRFRSRVRVPLSSSHPVRFCSRKTQIPIRADGASITYCRPPSQSPFTTFAVQPKKHKAEPKAEGASIDKSGLEKEPTSRASDHHAGPSDLEPNRNETATSPAVSIESKQPSVLLGLASYDSDEEDEDSKEDHGEHLEDHDGQPNQPRTRPKGAS
jgi:hypothetical protein